MSPDTTRSILNAILGAKSVDGSVALCVLTESHGRKEKGKRKSHAGLDAVWGVRRQTGLLESGFTWPTATAPEVCSVEQRAPGSGKPCVSSGHCVANA
eukprot:1776192-Rhodomonas_salina.1